MPSRETRTSAPSPLAKSKSPELFDARYARQISPEGQDSLSRIARRIPPGSRVLDVGTGPGALGRYLTEERACHVDGIESDPAQLRMATPYYRHLFAADLEKPLPADLTASGGYDAIVCADVLEHLRDPGLALDRLIPLLRAGGRIFVSIPNVGYAGIIAGLLAGEFAYRPTGLLDQTHFRFFTRRSLLDLLREHGLGALGIETVDYLLHQSEFRDHYLDELQPALREAILAQPDALTYQFVVEAAPGREHAEQVSGSPAPRMTFGLQLYYRRQHEVFDERRSVQAVGEIGVSHQKIQFALPSLAQEPLHLRLDIADRPGFLRIHSIRLLDRNLNLLWDWSGPEMTLDNAVSRGLVELFGGAHRLWIATNKDPSIELPLPAQACAAAAGGSLEIELDWPIVADSFVAQRRLDEQAAADAKTALAVQSLQDDLTGTKTLNRALSARIDSLERENAASAARIAYLEGTVAQLQATAHGAAAAADNAHLLRRLSEARDFARRIRRTVHPREFRLSVRPGSEIVGGDSEWDSIGADPWFQLFNPSGRLPTGWSEISIEILALGSTLVSPKLYYDEGGGIDEARSIPLSLPQSGLSRCLIKLPPRVHALRLDPMDAAGRFRLGSIRVKELSRPFAALKLAAPLLRNSARTPGGLAGAAWTGFRVLREEGWTAAKRRFRQATLTPPSPGGYEGWIHGFDALGDEARKHIRTVSAALPSEVSFAVVLVLSPEDDLSEIEATVESVERQLFEAWTGVVITPEPPSKGVAAIFRDRGRWEITSDDSWITAISKPLVAFLRAGERLAEDALFLFADLFHRTPQVAVAYADEDVLARNERRDPFFKPAWSPYRLWYQDYIRHRFACRLDALRAVGLPLASVEEQLFSFLLQSREAGLVVQRLPFVLYHLAKRHPRDLPLARRVLQDFLDRTVPGATISDGKLPDSLRVLLPSQPDAVLVSIIIPTRNRLELLRSCIESVRAHTENQPYELIVVDNGSDDPATLDYLAELARTGSARVLTHAGPFNFSAINNRAAREARGSVLLFLNNDIVIPESASGWLAELVAWAQRVDVGAVGCRLRYGDGKTQHIGVVIGMRGVAAHLQQGLDPDDPGYGGAAWTLREVGAATAACLAVRRDVFEGVHGFDEALRVAFNDVDLCLRIRQTGRAVIFTPFADLLHLESATRGADHAPGSIERLRHEIEHMRARHGHELLDDPFYSPNLSLKTQRPDLAFPPRVRKPWRAVEGPQPKLALLTYRAMKGYGVDVVVAEQIEYFCARGYHIALVVLEKDDYYDARFNGYAASGRLVIVRVNSTEEAAAYLASNGVDVAVAHTPPLYDALGMLPASAYRVLFDHGEPPPHLFPADETHRRDIVARKRDLSARVDLTVAISRFIQRDSALANPRLCFNGNDHLLRRRSNLRALAGSFRSTLGLDNPFVVLNVTRYLSGERRYKGVEHYAAVRDAFIRAHPELERAVVFVLAGRSEPDDQAWAASRGLVAHSNLDDDQLLAAYLDSDVYLSTSQWEGYNLGIAQALALGVPVVASAQGAHPEFPIRTSNDPSALAEWVYDEFRRTSSLRTQRPAHSIERMRTATVLPWRDSVRRLEELIRRGMETRQHQHIQLPLPPEPRPSEAPLLSILILNKDKPELLIPCIRSIEAHCRVPYEILIGDTGSTNPSTLQFYQTTSHQVHYLGFYHFSMSNNVLAARARGTHLLFLNNDTKFIDTDFLRALDYLREHPEVGCLGGYLVYADSRIQHAGVRICPEAPYRGIPEHFDRFKPIEGYAGRAAPREVVAVTGAMLLVEAERFAKVGGFDPVYREEAQDIDLCLRLREQGFRSVVHPALLSYHYENATRTVKESPEDRKEFLRRFGSLIENKLYAWQADAGLSTR